MTKDAIDNILEKLNAPKRKPWNILPDDRPKPKPKEITKVDNTKTPLPKEPNLWLGPKLPDWKVATPDDPCCRSRWPGQRPPQDQAGGVCPVSNGRMAGKDQAGGVRPITNGRLVGKEAGSFNSDLYWKRCQVTPENANISTHGEFLRMILWVNTGFLDLLFMCHSVSPLPPSVMQWMDAPNQSNNQRKDASGKGKQEERKTAGNIPGRLRTKSFAEKLGHRNL
ncbi:uncharacterized protein LOC144819281 isoform X2 [Lissotriton helveticus]